MLTMAASVAALVTSSVARRRRKRSHRIAAAGFRSHRERTATGDHKLLTESGGPHPTQPATGTVGHHRRSAVQCRVCRPSPGPGVPLTDSGLLSPGRRRGSKSQLAGARRQRRGRSLAQGSPPLHCNLQHIYTLARIPGRLSSLRCPRDLDFRHFWGALTPHGHDQRCPRTAKDSVLLCHCIHHKVPGGTKASLAGVHWKIEHPKAWKSTPIRGGYRISPGGGRPVMDWSLNAIE